MQLHSIISLGLAVGTTGFAVKYGDRTARRFGVSFLANWLVSLAVDSGDFQNTGLALFCVDVLTLIYFIWASLRARRIWTLIATAFMALIVASHLATTIDLRVTINTFRLGMTLCSYGILACVGFGTWGGWRERSRTLVPVAG